MKITLFILGILWSCLSFSQTAQENCVFQFTCNKNTSETKANFFKFSELQAQQQIPSSSDKEINFNASSEINVLNSNSLSSFLDSANHITVFTVLKKSSNEEELVWSFSANDSLVLAMTTSRIADLKTWKFFNHENQGSELFISSYTHKKENAASYDFKIGELENNFGIPVGDFSGLLAEVLIFNSCLSHNQINQIETYLSVKYGVTLIDKSYINSQGQEMWNKKTNQKYAQRITGIGRDDFFELNQIKSVNCEAEIDLTLEFVQEESSNTEHVSNLEFLIWGDNNKTIELDRVRTSASYEMERNWLIERSAIRSSHTHKMTINPIKINGYSDLQSHFLVIDKSGTGKYDKEHTEFITGELNQATGELVFDYDFDGDQSGKDCFTFKGGGPIFPKIWITQPSCSPLAAGSLHIGAEGNYAPFTYQVTNLTTESATENFEISDNRIFDISGIEPGDYEVVIEDSDGNQLVEYVYVEAGDAPRIDLKETYLLTNHPLILNVEIDQSASYLWERNNKTESTSSVFNPVTTGEYVCSVTADNCKAKKQFSILSETPEDWIGLKVFPNPSLDGDIETQIWLKEESAIEIVITDLAGRIVKSQSLPPSDFHYFPQTILESGTYIIKIWAENKTASEKFVITK